MTTSVIALDVLTSEYRPVLADRVYGAACGSPMTLVQYDGDDWYSCGVPCGQHNIEARQVDLTAGLVVFGIRPQTWPGDGDRRAVVFAMRRNITHVVVTATGEIHVHLLATAGRP